MIELIEDLMTDSIEDLMDLSGEITKSNKSTTE